MNEQNTQDPTPLTLEEQAVAQKQAIESYIAKVRAKIEEQKRALVHKNFVIKKNKAKMKKESQKIGRLKDKKFLKRKAKRDAKAQLNKTNPVLSSPSKENADAINTLSAIRN